MRRSLVRRIAVAMLLLPLVAFSVFAEDMPISGGALRWENLEFVVGSYGGQQGVYERLLIDGVLSSIISLGVETRGNFSDGTIFYDSNFYTFAGIDFYLSSPGVGPFGVDIVSSVSTPVYDFYAVNSLDAFISVYRSGNVIYDDDLRVRLTFTDDSSVTSSLDFAMMQNNVLYPINFSGIAQGSKSIGAIRYYLPHAISATTGATGYSRISEFSIVAPALVPPEPIDPPTPPTAGGSMTSFKVTAKNSGFGFVGLFYEDIVNSLYQQAILSEAWSYAQYPYTTVFNYRAGDDIYYYLMVTDKPFLSDMEIFEDMIRYGTYSQGISGVVFQCRIPDSVMTAGEEYPFIPMTSFSNVGPYDFIKAVQNDTPLPVYGESAVDMGVALAGIMSFEDSAVSLYTVCSNYALSAQSVLDNPALKQSFKYADSWAQLLRLSSGDASALLQQILDSLRKNDKSETVYTRIEQIYEIMSNLEQLPADSPVQSAIDESVSALEDWADNIDTAQLDEIVAVTAAVSDGIDGIIAALGIIGVMGGVGLVLGVIKVVLQR